MSETVPHVWFPELADAAPVPLLAVEAEHGAILAMNRLARETLGLQADTPTLRDLFDTPALARQFLLIARNNGFVRQFEARLQLAGGQRVWVLLAARLLEHASGASLIVSVVDIHERRLAEEALRESEQRHRRVLEAANEGYALFDARSGELLEVNPALCEMLYYPAEELLRLQPQDVVAEDSLARLEEARQRWQKSPQSHFELCLRRATGERITVEVSLSAIADQDGRITSLFALVSDITARKLNEERVLYLAFYDTLTALPNRFLFSEHMEQSLRQRQRIGSTLALLFIDLDDFKQVNDRFGHDVGDDLLREVARRLVSCVRASDTVSRQGGDEFIVLLNNLNDTAAAEQVAQKMLDALAEPVVIGPLSLRITCSIGIALCPEHSEDAGTLRRMADIAMYRAKQSGKHRFAVYAAPPESTAESCHGQ
jgi:diguanylate cyclase (GGDEF)-like protein/PAS domain S-box-containing protein